MTNEKQVELKILEGQQAEGIKELCYKAICNPDTNFSSLGTRNLSLGERRETLLQLRVQATKNIAALEKESEELLRGSNTEHGTIMNAKGYILEKLNVIMDIVSIIDKYSIENTKSICRKNPNSIVHNIGQACVKFPLVFNGDDVIVTCLFYEDICMDEKLLAQFLEITDEEKQLEFIKKHVVFGNITISLKEDIDKMETLIKEAQITEAIQLPEPVFVNIDDIYSIEVDK